MKRRWYNLAGAALGLALVLSACGGDDDEPSGSGELTVGGANFTEMNVMQEIYKALLEDAGYSVTITTADTRETYAAALEEGEIDVVPEYAATMAEYLNGVINGPDAPSESPVATADTAETVAAMGALAEERGLVVLEPAQATSQNGFAVSQEFADQNNVSTLSQLADLGLTLTLAATEECDARPFCQPGLEETYGLTIDDVLPLGFSSPQVKEAVINGDADFGLVGTTDGTLAGLGLVLLEDDQGLQLADALVPVVNAESAEDDTIAEVLNQLADVLTTEDLATLNARVDADRELAEDVAADYLTEKGLIGS